MSVSDRVDVIVIKNDTVLLGVTTDRFGQTQYFLPGGGIDKGETPEVAGVREVGEETGADVGKGVQVCAPILTSAIFGKADRVNPVDAIKRYIVACEWKGDGNKALGKDGDVIKTVWMLTHAAAEAISKGPDFDLSQRRANAIRMARSKLLQKQVER